MKNALAGRPRTTRTAARNDCRGWFGRAGSLVALAMALGGCAFGTREATLRYPPVAEPTSGTAQAATTQLPSANRGEIALAPFADARSDKSRVGSVRNGFGMQTASVVTKDDIAAWVTTALRTELTNAGYRVVDGASGTASGLLLTGDLTHLWCDSYFNYNGEVALDVRLRAAGQMLMNKKIEGNGSAGTNWAATAEAYGQTLALSLADALKKLVAEIDKVAAGR